MAAIIFIIDGLGGWSNPEFGWRTELEVANTPNFDFMAKMGECGLYNTIDFGIPPGSSGAMLSLLGYDPERPTRGVLAAMGLGIYEEGAWAARTNLATVRGGKVVDRRAGRLRDENLLQKIEEVINAVEPPPGMDVKYRRTLDYRGVLVMRFREDAGYIHSNDPEAPDFSGRIFPRAGNRAVEEKLKIWLTRVKEALEKIPNNPANFLLIRGVGREVPRVQPFYERYGARLAILSRMPYMLGIGKYIGVDVIPVDESNLAEVRKALELYVEKYDVLLVHVKGPDPYGHDGNFLGKVRAIEEIDRTIGPTLVRLAESHVVAVTGDHSTPALARRHTGDPCPLLVFGPGGRRDETAAFGERECSKGCLGHLKGSQLLHLLLDRIGLMRRIGA